MRKFYIAVVLFVLRFVLLPGNFTLLMNDTFFGHMINGIVVVLLAIIIDFVWRKLEK